VIVNGRGEMGLLNPRPPRSFSYTKRLNVRYLLLLLLKNCFDYCARRAPITARSSSPLLLQKSGQIDLPRSTTEAFQATNGSSKRNFPIGWFKNVLLERGNIPTFQALH